MSVHPADDRDTIAATVLGIGILVGAYERERRRSLNAVEANIATVAGWDRSVARLLESVANRHRNQPLLGAANPRGYCPACGGYFGERCPDMADVMAVCGAWSACVDVIRDGLDDRGAAELAEIFPATEGAPTS